MKAVLVACVLMEQDGRFLFVQQAAGRRQPSLWGPPGGKPEPGESLPAAAIRETQEETGLPVELTDLVGLIHSEHQPDPDLFICFAGRLPTKTAELKLKEGEISDGRWFSLTELEAGAVPLRSDSFPALCRRLQAGQTYPLELVQHDQA